VGRIQTIGLIAMPGGGKSTVGRYLAKRLNWKFIDSDAVIEKQIGCSIRSFFEREGEEAFREIEANVIAEIAQADRAVLATGGGAVLRETTRRVLREQTHVVYLRSTPEELFRRLRHDTQRPLLQVDDPQARLQELFAERDPLYREVADFIVETGRLSVHSLVNMALAQLELTGMLDPSMGTSSIEPPKSPE